MRNEDSWKITAAASLLPESTPWQPSSTVLRRVLATERTLFRKPPATEDFAKSLQAVDSVVASPIRNREEKIIGVLYGERRASGRQLGRLEARLIELLASGVSAAMARVEEETKAVRAQVCLQQFVTPEIARYVQDDPELLRGREEDVSLLFCDISGFSKIAHAQGPATTIAWLNDVLQELSQCVLDQEGTLVDYGGDEIFAMFGAPVPRTDHAQRAYAAGLAMMEAIPRLNERWKARVGAETSIGIGVNTGRVLVGNVGSALKLKYGAHGTHVNLASRVQSATRFFKVMFMATESTAAQLGDCPKRRLGAVRVKGIASPVQLFELKADPPADWKEMCTQYEEALAFWEAGDVEQATRRLSHLTSLHAEDGPTIALLNRALASWNAGKPAEPIWELPSK
jgi:adenylate cyclase